MPGPIAVLGAGHAGRTLAGGLAHQGAATRTAMTLSPDIIHVVGRTKADQASEAHELITGCSVVHQVIDAALLGLPDPMADTAITHREDRLELATTLLGTISSRFPDATDGDPNRRRRRLRCRQPRNRRGAR